MAKMAVNFVAGKKSTAQQEEQLFKKNRQITRRQFDDELLDCSRTHVCIGMMRKNKKHEENTTYFVDGDIIKHDSSSTPTKHHHSPLFLLAACPFYCKIV